MPTPFESAQLLLTLYDQRREPVLRKARDFVIMFDPKSFEELVATMFGPDGTYLRMVYGYWDMAASFVTNGAIDAKMFQDSTGEYIAAFCKVEPFIPQMREMFANADFLKHLESLTLSLPDARNRIDTTRERLRSMIAARAANAAKV